MQDLRTEYARALQGADVQEADGFGQAMRTGELNNFQNGDVMVLPELEIKEIDGKPVLVDKATGHKVVITEPMKVNGQPNGQTLKYMFVEVNRGSGKAVARLFPSIFWKRRREAKNAGTDAAPVWQNTDNYRQANGAVVDFAKNYPSVDEALVNISKQGKGIVINLEQFPAFRYQSDEITTESVANLEWA